MDESVRIELIDQRLTAAAEHWPPTTLSHFAGQPFKALIASMLSAQTRDENTLAAMHNLMALAQTPAAILRLSDEQIRAAIRPVMYYENKTRFVRDISQQVLANGDIVPRTIAELMAYKGVGWKVAVLTLAVGYGIFDDITVDVHVARISTRLGLVDPAIKQPPRINDALKQVLPRRMWAHWNERMVQFGRTVCKPTYPRCSECPVGDLCPKVGVQSGRKRV